MDSISLQLGTKNLWGWLVRLLCKHSEWLSAKVKFFLPNMDVGARNEASDPTQRVVLQLRKLHTQSQITWQAFIHCVCMELDVPLDLEVLLLSTWGHGEGLPSQLEADEERPPESQPHSGLKRPHQSCGSSPRPKQCRKQQRELAKRYLQLLRTFAQQRYDSRSPGPGQSVACHRTYIPPILQWNRASVPFDTQEGTVAGGPKAEDGTDVSIRDLFSAKANKGPRVTVLLGKAGMGKTTLAHRLCQEWADGQLERFQALFLFEFRQLNLITNFLTLPQLLFDLYLRPEAGPEAVFQYLEENANKILLIFDGLDEVLHPGSSKEAADPEASASALTLFSRLCHGTLLPGCWVMATSRPGKLPACLPTEVVTVSMWGFDGPRVEAYVSRFFSDQPVQEAALAELRASRHLWSMCVVPALCQVACLCLHHLLPGRSPGQSAALLPTVTQSYMQMVLSLSPQGLLPAESLMGLGEVALRGLETGKVVFTAGDIPPPTMAFAAALGLLTSFCVYTEPGHQETGYVFTHLSLQQFLAALHLMASPKVDRETLAQHVTLKSRWVLRTKARLGLLDHHLPTFLAGLASCACHPFLTPLAQQEEVWVRARQAAVMQALEKLATRKLTGPKLIELCHCVAETQKPELASLVAQSLPHHLSFRNFLLTYADLAALTNILGHRDAPIHLDFEGCPLEPHCPEALAGCGQVENLSFKSRKCGDAFAEALSRSLPTMGSLKKLGLSGSRITARGISHLVQALPLCPQLEEVSFQDNQLKDGEVLNIVEILPRLPQLRMLDLSRNSVSVSTLLSLTKVAVTYPTIRKLQVRETDLVFLLSPPTETTTELQRDPDLQENASLRKEAQRRSLELRLQKCQLRVYDVKLLLAQLRKGPQLDEVDLSGNQLEDEGCQLVAEAAPQLHIARKLDLSDNGLSVAGMQRVLSAVRTCRTLAELHISLLHKTMVLMFAPEPEEQEGIQKRLTHCGLQAQHLEQLCKALGGSCHLTYLDLSGNALGDEGVALLAQLLPGLGALQLLNLSENGLSLDAVFSLTQCFSTVQWLQRLDFSSESQHVILRGDSRGRHLLAGGSLPEFQAGAQFLGFRQRRIPRSFCLKECQLEPPSLSRLCETLEKCPGPLEVELFCKVLSDQSLETLLRHLPRLPQLSLLQLSQTGLSPRSPLLLADLFSLYPRVQKVDLRSLHHMTLHFRFSEEQEGGCCGRFTGCGLSQEHMEPLCWSLSKCEDLSQLDLSANLLGDDGLKSLLECLPQVPISGSLDLSHNGISQESALRLVETLPSCPRVREASVNPGSKQTFWIHFSRKEEARKTLRLSECSFRPEHVPRLATGLSQALRLTELTLNQGCLDLEQLTILLGLLKWPAGLLTLRVEEPWVGRAGVLTLLEVCAHASGNVTGISISETQEQLCMQLEFPHQENPEAVALRLAHCDLGTHHSLLVRELMETCARLRQLSLSHLPLGSSTLAVLIQGLSHMSLLQSLRLSRSGIDDIGCCHLSEALRTATSLAELGLSHNQIGDTGAEHLAAILPGLPELRKIDLSANGIGPAGGARLAESLTLCEHLEELMLDCNALGDLTALGLARGLPQHLRVLHLRSSHLGPEGALSLGQALDGCPYVEEISLAENSLAGGIPHFCQGLPLLRQIDLMSCEIDNQTAKPLAASFVLCPALEEIMLSWNLLGDEAAAELAQVLPRMGRLKRVDLFPLPLCPPGSLEKNRITAYGAWLLAEGLAQGSGIQVIRLWNNPIPQDTAQHLQSQEPRLDFAFFDHQPQVPWDA
ncbi:protein NLRC5 isoform X8 [Phacochoerus africanus]|uniref:protein NLRC5 isoform X8 n=1 Tax=Phacochoerus africanus TaxID=41426 RepID=UPI001FDAA828|nr:protein NLRC5 isoform X8 [Phacochoerus africanus]